MKLTEQAGLIFLIVMMIAIFLPQKSLANGVKQERFDSYRTDISWKEEMFRLDNFAIYLSRHREMVGYIGFYVGDKDSIRRVQTRVNRAKAYLIRYGGVNKSRIIIINAGKLESSTIILQPMPKNKSPDFGS